jgi:hypothetical protein
MDDVDAILSGLMRKNGETHPSNAHYIEIAGIQSG